MSRSERLAQLVVSLLALALLATGPAPSMAPNERAINARPAAMHRPATPSWPAPTDQPRPLDTRILAAGARVYVLRGGDQAADGAVVRTLERAGFVVTSGVETPDWNGSQANLRDFAAVVILYNQNWGRLMPLEGQQALRAYLAAGGGVVTGEWYVWRGQLTDLMPATNCGYNGLRSTVYTRATPDPVINAGVPLTLTLNLRDFSGTESCFAPRPGATVLYTSSNGGGRPGAPGLVAWNVGRGRVASFSNMLSNVELGDQGLRQLLANTVTWASQVRDILPPVIERFAIRGSGTLTETRQVSLSTDARDEAGGSGPGSLYFVEYVYNDNVASPGWVAVQRSGWLPYEAARNLTWTLTNQPGVHYVQVWAADRAGNISTAVVQDLINYQPLAPLVQPDEVDIYRLAVPTGVQVTVELSATAIADLYLWGPDDQPVGIDERDSMPKVVSFFAETGGVYQVEVAGYKTATRYRLSVLTGAPGGGGGLTIRSRPRGRPMLSFPVTPDAPPDLPQPPKATFLPHVQR